MLHKRLPRLNIIRDDDYKSSQWVLPSIVTRILVRSFLTYLLLSLVGCGWVVVAAATFNIEIAFR